MLTTKTILLSYLEDMSIEKASVRLKIKEIEVTRAIRNNRSMLEGLQSIRNIRLSVDADWVLIELLKMYNSDLTEILSSSGTLRPMLEWPKIWKTMISSFESKEMINKDGEKLGVSNKFNKPDALKLLEMIGKHTQIKAFIDAKADDEPVDSVIDKMTAGRDRVFKGKSVN